MSDTPNKFYRLVVFVLSGAVRTLFNIRVENAERLAAWQGGIVAANHISYFDPPVTALNLPFEVDFMAKSELFRIPLLGRLIRSLNALPIRRGGIDRRSMELMRERLRRGRTLLMFPEGSRRNFTARPGIGQLAIQSRTPVLPVLLVNTNRALLCMLRLRTMRIVIGETIPVETIERFPDEKDGYRALAIYILDAVNGMQS